MSNGAFCSSPKEVFCHCTSHNYYTCKIKRKNWSHIACTKKVINEAFSQPFTVEQIQWFSSFNHNYSQKIFNEVFKDWSKTLWKCNSPSYKVVHLLFKSALKAEYFQFKNAKKLPKETLGLQEHKRRDLKLHSYHCTERLVSKTLWAQEKPT